MSHMLALRTLLMCLFVLGTVSLGACRYAGAPQQPVPLPSSPGYIPPVGDDSGAVATPCPEDAKLCPDGSAVGRTGPSCTFPACPGEDAQVPADGNDAGLPFDEAKKTACTPAQRAAEVCIALYDPVCGWFDETIRCIKYPCAATYSNSCVACGDATVAYWTPGECPTG